jgi:hypothetical protein
MKNYKKLRLIIEKSLYILNTGYFTDDTLEKIDKLKINNIIMPKNTAITTNKEY